MWTQPPLRLQLPKKCPTLNIRQMVDVVFITHRIDFLLIVSVEQL